MPCAVFYLDSAYLLLFKNGILEECQFTRTHGRTQMCVVVYQNSEQKLHDWLLALHLSSKTIYHFDTPLNLSLSLAHCILVKGFKTFIKRNAFN